MRKYAFLLAALAVAVAAPAAVRSQEATPQPAVAVSDGASFVAWFGNQPGSHLLSPRVVHPAQPFPAPKSPDALANLASPAAFTAPNGAVYSATYDPASNAALVVVRSADGVSTILTRARSRPQGLPVGTLAVQTRNGARLGMSRDEVVAIEGPGTVLQFPDHKVLAYDQGVAGLLSFWFVDHQVAGIAVTQRAQH